MILSGDDGDDDGGDDDDGYDDGGNRDRTYFRTMESVRYDRHPKMMTARARR